MYKLVSNQLTRGTLYVRMSVWLSDISVFEICKIGITIIDSVLLHVVRWRIELRERERETVE